MIQEIYPYMERAELIQHVSDKGKMLRKVGTDELYSEPVDVYPCQFQYEETEIDIPKPIDSMQNIDI